jgi:membrane glycosyltransferase
MDAITPAGTLFLPAEAPCPMPVQDLFGPFEPQPAPATGPATIGRRRLFVFALAFGASAVSAWQMYEVLAVAGLTLLEGAVLFVFTLLNAWLSLSLASVLGGVVASLTHGDSGIALSEQTPIQPPSIRTAILMPTYNEDPARVFGGLAATVRSLQETGHDAAFDVFILSDTTDADIWVQEEETFLALRASFEDFPRIFYRRRARNTDRKAGNIADWVQKFGDAYEAMIILDADSVMRGATLVRLARAMSDHPRVGLIQTLPALVQGRTVYARAQSFAGRLYGPLIARGITWWHGAEGNFWGHNAILRVKAFAQSAGLPHLPGAKPFGGHILSHDFVEAALLRRAGWGVHMAPDLEGSYEQGPPTIGDNAVRDRRWAQGNLQHLRILGARGLSPISRSHLVFGIASYLTSPLLVLLIVLGLALAIQAQIVVPDYFPKGFSLYPTWPAQDPVRALMVMAGTMAILMLPKIVAFGLAAASSVQAARFGGRGRLALSFVQETALSAMLSPIAMLDQTRAVLSILMGGDSGWQAQQREEAVLPWRALVRAYWLHSAFGGALALGAFVIEPTLCLWMMPVWLGLLLSIPLARFASRRASEGGMPAPEDVDPPPELVGATHERARLGKAVCGGKTGLERLLASPGLLFAHLSSLPNLGERVTGDYGADRLVARTKIADSNTRSEAIALLSPDEARAALSDRVCLQALVELGT